MTDVRTVVVIGARCCLLNHRVPLWHAAQTSRKYGIHRADARRGVCGASGAAVPSAVRVLQAPLATDAGNLARYAITTNDALVLCAFLQLCRGETRYPPAFSRLRA